MLEIKLNKHEVSILTEILNHHVYRVDDNTWINQYGKRTVVHVISFLKKIGGYTDYGKNI